MSACLPQKNCWIFCNVIDNYGDIGVSWRLANILHSELNLNVCLWVDQPSALQALCPDLPTLPCTYQNIHLRTWQPDHAYDLPEHAPQIVIETFGCNLPDNIIAVIKACKPLWLNWEYLSAEDSNERLHALPSLQANGIQKYFWFMGFSEKSGGLLREKNYRFQPASDHSVQALRRELKLPEKNSPEWLLFGYKSGVWHKWLDMWQQAGQAMTLMLAGTQIIESLKEYRALPDYALRESGDTFQIGCIRLIRIPFVAQNRFDDLLQLSDGLLIRGEDSFVRAQFSGKPFFWHIYPQDEKIHIDKLHAFWNKAYPYYPEETASAHQALSDELNQAVELTEQQRLSAWQTLWRQMHQWQQGAASWQNFLFNQASATEKLAKFIEDNIK